MIFHAELFFWAPLSDMIDHVELRPTPRAQIPLRPSRWISSVATRSHAHTHNMTFPVRVVNVMQCNYAMYCNVT